MEYYNSTVSGRNKAEFKKNALRKLSMILEMCNEAILYFDEAKQLFQQSYELNPRPYMKQLIEKCDKELNGFNGLNEKKNNLTRMVKELKSKK
jgi:hypothetical protein